MEENNFIILAAATIFLSNAFVLFEIPYLQEVFGFLFLILLPGLLILRAAKANGIDFWKIAVYSIGLSVAFVMIFSLAINFLYPLIGISKPLATIPLLITFDAILASLLFGFRNEEFLKNKEIPRIYDFKNKFLFLIPFLFPVLAIIGAYQLRVNPESWIPMILLAVMALYVLLISALSKDDDISKKIFAFAIFMIAVSLLFMVSLRSGHIFGCDIHGEYFVSQLTKDAFQWKPLNYAYNPALSVSLLPVILSSILSVNEELIFNILFQVLFAFVPLIIFLFLSKYVKPAYAFLAAFFFLSIEIFSHFMSIARSEIAFLFVALSILVLFDDDIGKNMKKLLFIVFSITTILSHYTVSYIYFGLLLTLTITKYIYRKKRDPYLHLYKKHIDSNLGIIAITTIFLFFAIIFFWHGQVITTPFEGFVGFVEEVIQNLKNLLVFETRSAEAISAVSIPKGEFLGKFSSYVSNLMKLFIIIGFGYLAKNYKKLNIDRGFVAISFYSLMFVILSIVLPLVSYSINIERIFLQALMILCFCNVLGAKFIFESIGVKGRAANVLIALLIILFFLFQLGFIYNFSDNPTSPALSDDSLSYKKWYVHEQEVSAARWLSEQNPDRVYGDHDALLRLWSYGRLIPTYALAKEKRIGYLLEKDFELGELVNSYVYLRRDNVLNDNFLIKEKGEFVYINSLTKRMQNKNKVYDNGGSLIFR